MTPPVPGATRRPSPTPPPAAGAKPLAGGRPRPFDAPFDPVELALRLHDTLGSEMVYRFRLLPHPYYEYVSRACVALTGYTPEEHYADPDLGMKVVHPDDLPILEAVMRGQVGRGSVVLRWIRRDGSVVWTEHRARMLLDELGRPAVLEGIARDVTDLAVAADSARTTAGAVRALVDASAALGVTLDPSGRVTSVNDRFAELTGWTGEDLEGRLWTSLVRDLEPGQAAHVHPTAGAALATVNALVLPDGRQHVVRWSKVPLLDAHGLASSTALLGDDLTAGEEVEAWAAELAAAVALSGESVVVTDTDANILYVNGAFERTTGFSAEQAVGHNPRILQSGHQSAAFYKVMWLTLRRGKTWRGELVNRRQDGTLLVEEAAVTPVTGTDGSLIAYVAVKRDVTRLRQLRANLDDANLKHDALTAALSRLGLRPTIEETCDDIASVLCELPSALAAGVVLLDAGSEARLAGSRSTTPMSVGRGFVIPNIGERMLQHPDQGPWVEPVGGSPTPELEEAMEAGIRALLIVPVRHEGLVLGALLVAGADSDGAYLMRDLPAAAQVAAVARSLLAPLVAGQLARQETRARIQRIISNRRFHTVFQPIVDLFTGGIVGFEALARFDDMVSPKQHFDEAAECGAGVILELAAIETALTAAESLPEAAMLCLNVSPATIMAPELNDVLAGHAHPIVLEITEHAPVDDYPALQEALAALRPDIRLAVDDAGAGGANLQHLIQLRPDFVKLDMSLVHRIDADLTRQALLVGLKEFARVSGRALIAKGVETDLERTTLTELSVRFGQGYLLGAPAPADAWTHVRIEDPEAFAGDSAAAAWQVHHDDEGTRRIGHARPRSETR